MLCTKVELQTSNIEPDTNVRCLKSTHVHFEWSLIETIVVSFHSAAWAGSETVDNVNLMCK